MNRSHFSSAPTIPWPGAAAVTGAEHEAVIVGAGPVGLFLAICLLKRGMACKILENRHQPVSDSRSLGIHPVSLELFDQIGISGPFLDEGVTIKRGVALCESGRIGEIDFSQGRRPHNYVLCCPQSRTEAILRRELFRLDPCALETGSRFLAFTRTGNRMEVRYRRAERELQTSGAFLIGCDGRNSAVRRELGIRFDGKRYPDTYIMGDFRDDTSFGNDAAVFLSRDGLVESFPLPHGRRRWVLKTPDYLPQVRPELLAAAVEERTGHRLDIGEGRSLSSFGTERRIAATLVKDRVLLAGDAAHVVSPIGGQGMNLGWLGAWRLAAALTEGDRDTRSVYRKLAGYGRDQRGIAAKTARRAELNMRLGRARSRPWARNLIVRAMLNTHLRRKTLTLFTMRGLN